jgi:hypothetical protein
MAYPPIIPGLTETAQTSSTGDLMQLLARTSDNSPPTSGQSLLREAMATLRQAGNADPKLQQRIARALAVIEGNDETSTRARESGRGQDHIGPMLGSAKTPI